MDHHRVGLCFMRLSRNFRKFNAEGLQLNFTSSESVYAALSNAFSGDFGRNFMSMGIAVTTVPVPAAIWFFGSALGLLGWMRSKAS